MAVFLFSLEEEEEEEEEWMRISKDPDKRKKIEKRNRKDVNSENKVGQEKVWDKE